MTALRVGLIVPSSNTTMETEIPAMLHLRETIRPERFTFHSSRMRMKHVTPEELRAMDCDSERCAVELADADVDVMAYACLVAIMAQGEGYHRASEKRLRAAAMASANLDSPVISSAGALVEALGRCVDAGLLSGDPLSLATIFFSLSHGLTSLALMGWFGPPEQADAAWGRAERALFVGLMPSAAEG